MKMSLHTRRTSPPLNIAQNYKKESSPEILCFNLIGGPHPLFFFFFFFFLGGGGKT